METAIYGLDSLGHNALSLNAIIANRAGTFSADPITVDELIGYTLDRLAKN
jgi:uridine phosphorylase